MGFRTVVIFNNDQIHDTCKDPSLGENVLGAMASFGFHDIQKRYTKGFEVVEVCHADTVTIARIDSLSMKPLAHGWYKQDDVDLIREAADKLGYRLVKKSK